MSDIQKLNEPTEKEYDRLKNHFSSLEIIETDDHLWVPLNPHFMLIQQKEPVPIFFSEGVAVTGLSTYYGKLNYTLTREGTDRLRLVLNGDLTLPPGKIVVKPPLPRSIVHAEVNGRKIEAFDTESVRCGEYPADVVMFF
jgi:hypothetical protein